MYKQFPLRLEIKNILKINFISKFNKRSNNKQLEHIIQNYINDFEKINGKIDINENSEGE